MPTASIAGETLGIGPRNSRLRRWVLARAQVAGDWVMLKGAGCTRIQLLLGAGISKELTMIKSILAVTILALSTSGALAAHHRTHHHATKATANVGAPPPVGAPPSMMGAPPPFVGMGGVSSSDRADRVKVCANPGITRRMTSTRTRP